jgi:hypothetical protein
MVEVRIWKACCDFWASIYQFPCGWKRIMTPTENLTTFRAANLTSLKIWFLGWICVLWLQNRPPGNSDTGRAWCLSDDHVTCPGRASWGSTKASKEGTRPLSTTIGIFLLNIFKIHKTVGKGYQGIYFVLNGCCVVIFLKIHSCNDFYWTYSLNFDRAAQFSKGSKVV